MFSWVSDNLVSSNQKVCICGSSGSFKTFLCHAALIDCSLRGDVCLFICKPGALSLPLLRFLYTRHPEVQRAPPFTTVAERIRVSQCVTISDVKLQLIGLLYADVIARGKTSVFNGHSVTVAPPCPAARVDAPSEIPSLLIIDGFACHAIPPRSAQLYTTIRVTRLLAELTSVVSRRPSDTSSTAGRLASQVPQRLSMVLTATPAPAALEEPFGLGARHPFVQCAGVVYQCSASVTAKGAAMLRDAELAGFALPSSLSRVRPTVASDDGTLSRVRPTVASDDVSRVRPTVASDDGIVPDSQDSEIVSCLNQPQPSSNLPPRSAVRSVLEDTSNRHAADGSRVRLNAEDCCSRPCDSTPAAHRTCRLTAVETASVAIVLQCTRAPVPPWRSCHRSKANDSGVTTSPLPVLGVAATADPFPPFPSVLAQRHVLHGDAPTVLHCTLPTLPLLQQRDCLASMRRNGQEEL